MNGLAGLWCTGSVDRKGTSVASTNNRARRVIAVGAFAVAAAVAPAVAAIMTTGAETSTSAQPACLAWFGNKEDGKCLSYSNGNGVNVGTPSFQIGNPDNGNRAGFSTGPLLPGMIVDKPLG